MKDLIGLYISAGLDRCSIDEDPMAWDRRLGRLLQDLDPGGKISETVWFQAEAKDERAIRRWCWSPGWELMSQDEDLLLMNDKAVPLILEEATYGCPKRDYAVHIVAHHVRGSLHHSLWGSPPNLEKIDSALARAEHLLPMAEKSESPDLATYLKRLAGYRQRRKIRRAEAEQRVLDLRSCTQSPKKPVVLNRKGGNWVADLLRGNVAEGSLHIERNSGIMWAEEIS